MMRPLPLILALALGGAALVAQGPARTGAPPPAGVGAFDVVGFRLGMTEAEVVNAATAHDRAARVRRVSQPLPNVAPFVSRLYVGVYGDDARRLGDEVFKVELSNPTPAPRVMAIWRRQLFPPGAEASLAETVGALRAKYGAPRYTRALQGTTTWMWADAAVEQTPCFVSQEVAFALDINILTSGFVEPRTWSASAACGATLSVGVRHQGDQISDLALLLIDHAAVVRADQELTRAPAPPAAGRGAPKL